MQMRGAVELGRRERDFLQKAASSDSVVKEEEERQKKEVAV
jgi:hypothetical protein